MKEKEFAVMRYNFYTTLNKIVKFYNDYLKGRTKKEIMAEANRLKSIFDIDLFVDSEEAELLEADSLARDIENLFETPVVSIGDLIEKGYIIMELKQRIELFEFLYR